MTGIWVIVISKIFLLALMTEQSSKYARKEIPHHLYGFLRASGSENERVDQCADEHVGQQT
jgi:hypothetical protein